MSLIHPHALSPSKTEDCVHSHSLWQWWQKPPKARSAQLHCAHWHSYTDLMEQTTGSQLLWFPLNSHQEAGDKLPPGYNLSCSDPCHQELEMHVKTMVPTLGGFWPLCSPRAWRSCPSPHSPAAKPTDWRQAFTQIPAVDGEVTL